MAINENGVQVERQYIGARYVPKFFQGVNGNPEWVAGLAYEALTIVTYLGNSFTSKVPVPAGIGNPANNPTYWVNTGNYNAQVEEIKNTFIKYIRWFDTLEQLILSDIQINFLAATNGYHKLNDGGSAFYVITNIRPKGYFETLNNGLYAILLNPTNCKQFGCYGDGEHNDTQKLQIAINECTSLYIPAGAYMVDTITETTSYNIVIPSNRSIILDDNAIIEAIPNTSANFSVLAIIENSNISITGGKIKSDKSLDENEWGMGITVRTGSNINISNIEIFNSLGDGIYIGGNDATNTFSSNISIENVSIHDCRRNGISFTAVKNAHVNNCEIFNIKGTNPMSAIDIEKNTDNQTNDSIIITNCNCYNNGSADIVAINNPSNINIKNCVLGNSIAVWSGENIKVENITTHNIANSNLDFIGGTSTVINCLLKHMVLPINNAADVKIYNSVIEQANSNYNLITVNNNQNLELYNCVVKAKNTGVSNAYLIQTFEGSKIKIEKCTFDIEFTFRGYFILNGESEIIESILKNVNSGDQGCLRLYKCTKFEKNIVEYAKDDIIAVGQNNPNATSVFADNLIKNANANYLISISNAIKKLYCLNNTIISTTLQNDEGLVYKGTTTVVSKNNTITS